MPLSHEEISKSLLESGAINYDALGQWVAKIGPELAIRDGGWHGVMFGKYNTLACQITAGDLAARVGDLNRFKIAQQVVESSLDAT